MNHYIYIVYSLEGVADILRKYVVEENKKMKTNEGAKLLLDMISIPFLWGFAFCVNL